MHFNICQDTRAICVLSITVVAISMCMKTQSVVLGGNPRHRRFFVRQVALIFRLTVGAFAFLAAVGFLAYC